MGYWGKVVGGMAGFAMGGPLGMVMGAAVGHAADSGGIPFNFRTNFLDETSLTRTSNEIDDYHETVGNMRAFATEANYKQPGDPEKLAQAGVQVSEIIVYKTTQTPQVVNGQYDGIAFFSPSAVHSFFAMNTLPAPTRLFAIGQTTADTIRTYTNNPAILSSTPSKEALVQQMIDYFQKNI